MHALSPEEPFGKDSDTILTKWYSKGASGWGMLFSLEAPFGKDYKTILTRWGFQDNSKKSKSDIPQLVQITSPGEDALPDEAPQGDYGVWGLKALST